MRARLTFWLLLVLGLLWLVLLSGVFASQDAAAPPLPRELVLQRQIDDLTEQLRTLEFELAGCRGQLLPYAQKVSQDLQQRRAAWKHAVEEALGSGWRVNEQLQIVAAEEAQA